MKKLLALILTISMLLSLCVMPLGVNATELTEEERLAKLNETPIVHISLEEYADVDAYTSLAAIGEYGRFNTPLASGKHLSKSTIQIDGTDTEVFNYLPYKAIDGTLITGTEDFYYKGFYTKELVLSRQSIADYTMLADDLLLENGADVVTMRYSVSGDGTPAVLYSDPPMERTEYKRTVRASHVVSRSVEDGKNYAVISNQGITHKIGPIDGENYSLNSVYLSNGNPTIAAGETGKTLSLLVGTHNFSGYQYAVGDTAVGAGPKASLNKVIINYEDGDKETKYFVMTNGVGLTNKDLSNAELTIVYAPKQDSWTAADLYGAEKVTAKVLNNENSAEHGIADVSALTAKDIIFDNPDILMTDSATVASWTSSRQDACILDYGQRVTMANVALKEKEVTSFQPFKFFNYLTENIDTAIPIGYEDVTQLRQAFIPVTVKGASEDYDYFAYVGVTTDYCALLGASVCGETPREKIDALNSVLSALDSDALTEEDIAGYRAQIAELKAESEYILDSDFDTTALDAAEKRIEEEKAEADRVELLNKGETTYIDFIKDIPESLDSRKVDLFTDIQTLGDYATFYRGLDGANATYAHNADVYYDESTAKWVVADETYEGTTYKYQIPDTTKAGVSITGDEGYYKKGMLPSNPVYKLDPTVFLMESVENPNGTYNISMAKYGTSGKKVTDSATRSDKSIKINARPSATVETTSDGSKYFYYQKNNAKFKVGPVKALEFSPNSFAVYQNDNANTLPISVNAKGSYLDILMTGNDVNGATVSPTINYTGSAKAALQKVQINYESGDPDTVYIPVWDAAGVKGDPLVRSIVYAPKKYDDEGQQVNYTIDDLQDTSVETPFKAVSEIADIAADGIEDITMDDIIWPEGSNIYSGEMEFAEPARGRMDQVATTPYGSTEVSAVSIPVDNTRAISTINFMGSMGAGATLAGELASIGAIQLTNSSGAGIRGFIPVTIKGAKEEYVYYIYVARLCNYASNPIAISVRTSSPAEKIAEVNEQLADAETKEEIIVALDAMKALIDASEGIVLAKDFDTASAVAKLTEYLNADIEAAETADEITAIETEVDGYVAAYGIDATTLKAAIAAAKEAFAAERLSQPVYAPVEMDFFMDIFATNEERAHADWYDSSKSSYLNYKGWSHSGQSTLPMIRTVNTSGVVFAIDKGSITSNVSLKDVAEYDNVSGRYNYSVGDVTYRLGEILENAKGNNAFIPGTTYKSLENSSLPYGPDEINNDIYVYESSIAQRGKFPVNMKGITAVNVLATSQITSTKKAYLMPVVVYYSDGKTQSHWLAVGSIATNLMNTLVYSPVSSTADTYSSLEALIGTNTLDKIKSDIDYSDMAMPSALDDNNEPIVHTGKITYESFILPEASGLFADAIRSYNVTNGKTNVYSYSIPVDPEKTVTHIEFYNEGGSALTTKYYPAVGGCLNNTESSASAFIPLTVDGIAEDQYNCYIHVTRNCGFSTILGMTAETTGEKAVASLNTLMASAATEADAEKVEALKAFIDGENLLYSDLSEESVNAYNSFAGKLDVSGTIEVAFEEGVASSAAVEIKNVTALAGKPYKVILAYYDADENYLGTKIVDRASTTDKEVSFTVEGDNMPSTTKAVKGFIWRDFTTLIPLTVK